jgi:hypothetical protein
MTFLKARWKSKVYVKASTKAELTKAENLPMGSVKVQMMAPMKAMLTEAQSPLMVLTDGL